MNLEASLVNPEHLDPSVYLFFPETGEAILIDCGYIFPLKARDIQRIHSIFISHFHIDHCIGLDHVLRVCLGMPNKEFRLFGPPGTISRMQGKLRGYLWNLCTDFSLDFRVFEASGDELRWTLFKGHAGFTPVEEGVAPMKDEVLLDAGNYKMRCAFLEHKFPVLAFLMECAPAVNVDKDALLAMGLRPGPWIKRLKEADPGESGPMEVEGRSFAVSELRSKLLKTTPGKKIAYITDTIFNKVTAKKAIALAAGADELFCEAPYLTEEKDLAREYFHLTAKQAATIAKEAGVGKLHLFHFSRRYDGSYEKLFEEAAEVFPAVERARFYRPEKELLRTALQPQ